MVEILNLAHFWRVSPEEVSNWSISDFLDRQEYMFIVNDIEPSKEDDCDPDRIPWQGPKE